jgi:hypothetical protein
VQKYERKRAKAKVQNLRPKKSAKGFRQERESGSAKAQARRPKKKCVPSSDPWPKVSSYFLKIQYTVKNILK